MQTNYENDYALYALKDNFICITYKEGSVIDLKAAMEIVRDRITFQEEKPFPVLCDIRKIESIEMQARDYLTNEGLILVKALAILVKPGAIALLAQIHHKSNEPRIKTDTFLKLSEAKVFLSQSLGYLIPCCLELLYNLL